MDINLNTNLIYLSHKAHDIVSVIDGNSDELLITPIPVGVSPRDIAVNPNTNKIYVINEGKRSDSISVIDGEINEIDIDTTIPISNQAGEIAFNSNTNILYITYSEPNRVLLIDPNINRVIFPRNIIFNVNPINAGVINCDDKKIITNQSLIDQNITIPFGTKCIAKANEGFQFNSWVENIRKNSIKTINASTYTFNLLQFPSFFEVLGFRFVDSASIFTITEVRSGIFTANFKETSPPIPSEYLVGLFTIVATTIIGWSIPNIIGWIKTKREIRKLNFYHKRINSLYDDGRLDEKDIQCLNKLKENVSECLYKGEN